MNKIGKLVAFLLLLLAQGQLTTDECRLSDIKTIIGGRDYSVDYMRGSYFEHADRYMLLAYGRLTINGGSQGFLFLYDYNICESSELRLVQYANQGIREAAYAEGYICLVGYNELENGTLKEIFGRIKLGQNRNENGRSIYFLEVDLDKQNLWNLEGYDFQGFVQSQGLIPLGKDSRCLVIRQDTMTRYNTPGILIQYKFNEGANILAYAKAYEEISFIVEHDSQLKFHQVTLGRFTFVDYCFTLTKEDSTISHAKMIAKRTNYSLLDQAIIALTQKDQLRVFEVTLFNRILYWADDDVYVSRFVVQQVILDQNFRTIHLSQENEVSDPDGETSVMLIALDPDNVMHAIKIKLNQNRDVYATIESHFVTKPVESVAFDINFTHLIRSSRNWDFWLFGATNSVLLFGEKHTFSQRIGFIMSTDKNRLTKLWQPASTDIAVTFENSDVTNVILSQEDTDEEDDIFKASAQNFSENALPYFPPVFDRKNDWINEQNACKTDLGIQNVDSTCYVYDIFKQPAALYLDLQTLSKHAPRQYSSCNQEERLLYNLYEDMALDQKMMRNICFPKTKEILSAPSPPVTLQGKSMVNVDKQNFQLSWIDEATPELNKEVWSVQIQEFDDFISMSDKVIAGFNIKAQYKVSRISHVNVDFEASRPLEYSFFPKERAYDFHVSVKCWSVKCPSYFKLNEHSMYLEFTNERVTNTTSVYFVEITQLSKVNVIKYTLSFTVKQKFASSQNTVGINITDEFDKWYAANKKILHYYVPPITKEVTIPSTESKENNGGSAYGIAEGTEASYDAQKTDLLAKLEPQTAQFIKEWSAKDILLAVQEAKERLKKKPTVNTPKMMLSSTGLLTITFESDIQMPSYLKNELNSLIASEQVIKPPVAGKRQRRLGLFTVKNFMIELQNDQSGIDAAEAELMYWRHGCDQEETKTCYWNANQGECHLDADNKKKCTPDFCNPTIDIWCYPIYETCSNPKWEPECVCPEPTGEFDWYSTKEDQENCIRDAKLSNTFCQKGKCRKDYCDPKTDKTCYINFLCTKNTMNCTYYNHCDPLADPTCGNQNCDPAIDVSCKKKTVEKDCDALDPSCKNYVKPVEEPILQETTQNITCDQNDPNSYCYKPPESVAPILCFETQYLDEKSDSCVYYQIYFGTFEQLFKVEALARDADGRISEQITQNLKFKKKVVSATNNELVIQLEFKNAIDDTHNEFIKVTTNFASFNSGIAVSETEISLPQEVFHRSTNKSLQNIAEASKSVIVTAAIGTAVMRTTMQASLSQLWGMINGIQFIIHIPCINLNFPTNSFTVLKQLIAVATFELPSVNLQALKGKWKVEKQKVLTDLPENVVSSMDQLGYNDANLSNTMGTGYIIILGVILGLLIILVSLPCSRLKFCSKLNQWLRNKLLWNFVIRLLLEQSLETTYSIVLTFKYGSFSTTAFGTDIDYIIAALLALCIVSLPIFMVIFYLKNYENWECKEFEETYGAPLKGLKKTQKSSLFYPVYFVLRRAVFCFTTLLLYDNVVIQLYIHHLLTMGSIAYLDIVIPQEEPLEYYLELMNEYFTVLAIDLCFLFTDLDSNRSRQYKWGFVLIVTIVICVGVHVFFLFKHMITILIQTVKTARKKGLMKTFPSLRKVLHILRVLTCRTKFDISRLREKKESSDESDSKKLEKSSKLSQAEQSVNEDQEVPENQPQLLKNPEKNEKTINQQTTLLQNPVSNDTRRNQSSFRQNLLTEVHQDYDQLEGCFEVKTVGQFSVKKGLHLVIEEENLVQAKYSQNQEVRDYQDLNSKCDYIANEILSSQNIASVDNVQDIEDDPYNSQTERHQEQIMVAMLNEKKHHLRSLDKHEATVNLAMTENRVDYEVEPQVNSAILLERITNLQVSNGVPE